MQEEVGWPIILVCPGLKGFQGHEVFIAKSRRVPGKLKQVGYPKSIVYSKQTTVKKKPVFINKIMVQ